MKRPRRLVLLPLALLLIGNTIACSVKYTSDHSSVQSSVESPSYILVAVAPLGNQTNYVEAPDAIQSAFVEELRYRGWNVMSQYSVNERLRESLGINYGEQLQSTSPEEVCRILGVEGVFYGEVLDWKWFRLILINSHSVEAAIRMYRRDGVLVWDGGAARAKEWHNMPVRKNTGPVITEEEQEEALEYLDFFTGNKLRSVEDVARIIADRLPHDILSRTVEMNSQKKP